MGRDAAAARLRRRRASSGRIDVATADGRSRDLHRAPRHQLGAGARTGGQISPRPISYPACARAALSRLPHRRADGQEARSFPRQLDLHPRSVREGRPGAELRLVVARDGAGRNELPRARIFLLRGRRPVDQPPTRIWSRWPSARSRQIGLIQDADVVDACVVRQPKAYPVYDDDYATTSRWSGRELETSYPTLHLVGRNGMHKYNNQDHAMMTAMLTAREHPGRRARLRRVARQRGRRVPRGRRHRARRPRSPASAWCRSASGRPPPAADEAYPATASKP